MLQMYDKKVWVNRADLFRLMETSLIAMAGGGFFSILHLPLAWMLGPLTGVLLWQAASKRRLYWPRAFRNGGQLLLGYSMGLSFTAESARQIGGQLPSMFVSTMLMVSFGLVLGYFISRFTGINLPSGVMGTTPGGLSQMVLLSEEIKGAEPTIVTFMQTIRMLIVIFAVPSLVIHGIPHDARKPFLSTDQIAEPTLTALLTPNALLAAVLVILAALLAVRFKFPTPWIIGPLITSAIFTLVGWPTPHLPQSLIIVSQCCLGTYLGLGFKLNTLGNWRRLLPYAFASGILIVMFAFFIAYVLTLLYPINLVTAFLSIAPGGLPEMGVTAHMVNADVSMVAAYQLFRVFFILFLLPLALRWAFGKHNPSLSAIQKKMESNVR
jgi:uncharacterized protein